MQRRKTLLNALVNNGIFNSKEQGNEVLEKIDMDINIRGEKLTLEDYARLSDEISKNYFKK